MLATLAAPDAPLADKAKLTWTDAETQYFLFEGKVRKTLSKQGEKVQVLEAEAARAAWAKQVQSLIVADKETRKRGMATMHYGDSYDIIFADAVLSPEAAERQRIAAGKPASASHELTLALEARARFVTPYFDHAGLTLAPGLRRAGTELVGMLEKAYPNNKFEVPEPPAPPAQAAGDAAAAEAKKEGDAPTDAPPEAEN